MTAEFTIKANIDELLNTIIFNRDNHRDTFEQALTNYHNKAIEEFEKRIERIKKNKDFSLYVNIPVPEDHTEDYDRVIKMLQMHKKAGEDFIEISEHQFSMYICDEWAWRKQWLTNTQSYTTSV